MADKEIVTRADLQRLLNIEDKEAYVNTLLDNRTKFIDLLNQLEEKIALPDIDKSSRWSEYKNGVYNGYNTIVKGIENLSKVVGTDSKSIMDGNMEIVDREEVKVSRHTGCGVLCKVLIRVPVGTSDIEHQGLKLTFGPYIVTYWVESGYGIRTFTVEGTNEDIVDNGWKMQAHMAVLDGRLCMGTGEKAGNTHMRTGNIWALHDVVTTVLSNFTTSGYRTMEAYTEILGAHGCRCRICGEWVTDEEKITCSTCGYGYCKDHAKEYTIKCDICGAGDGEVKILCSQCIANNELQTTVGGKRVCKKCIVRPDVMFSDSKYSKEDVWECSECKLVIGSDAESRHESGKCIICRNAERLVRV